LTFRDRAVRVRLENETFSGVQDATHELLRLLVASGHH
jgi:hypothetical protein